MADVERRTGGEVVERTSQKTQEPTLYKVVLHNDDYTTMDFVVHVLQRHFAKSEIEATYIMLQVHHGGRGVAGEYTRDVAETKVADVTAEARAEGMPMRLTAEPCPSAEGGGAGDGDGGAGGPGGGAAP